MAVNTCYISRSCNRVPHCLDWGKNNLICYGSCHSIALYDPKFSDTGAICQTFTNHTDRVNCVRWIKQPDNVPECELVSASSDKTAVVWRLQSGSKYSFKPSYKLLGHTDVVNVADAVHRFADTIIVTASSDCTIKVWCFKSGNGAVLCNQTIKLGSHFALDLKLSYHLNVKNAPLLIFGGSDAKVHIFIEHNSEFVKSLSLSGHEEWIRAIDTVVDDGGELLIASCSQDCYIRLWRLTLQKDDHKQESSNEIKLRGNSFTWHDAGDVICNVGLEAIMAGHENWIYGLHWHPHLSDGQPLQLLSASMDKTMILWELDSTLGVWIEKVRVGEVGGNTLGFYGNRFSPDGQSILAHGFQGAFHLWHFQKETNKWEPGVTVGGHFSEVSDLDWDSGGHFIISVSLDQTTRLHAPWCKKGTQNVWYEMARPQIHGYDMTCIAGIGRHKFASGADEKVLRAFQAPKNFTENFYRLSGISLLEDDSQNESLIPEGASVPGLGLSNKAIFEKITQLDLNASHPKDIYPEAYFRSTVLMQPPTEETLLQNTLWPEIHKMYGHGYEIYSIASNKSGTLLASACKATKPEHAKIIIWSTTTWKEIIQLAGHSLTVTQMEFSPSDCYLLSVSRDRMWCLFELLSTEANGLNISKVAYSDKKTGIHSRIIWCCAWTHDSHYFVTGSRDKKLIVWGNIKQEADPPCLGNWGAVSEILESKDSITAVDFAPVALDIFSYLIAIGVECGTIYLYRWNPSIQEQWQLCHTLDNAIFHHLTVKRLRFRPILGCAGNEDLLNVIQLASCGWDHAVYVFNILWKSI